VGDRERRDGVNDNGHRRCDDVSATGQAPATAVLQC
jgi:hypothetical protein